MQPGAEPGGIGGSHATGEQSPEQAGEHIPRPRSGHPRVTGGVLMRGGILRRAGERPGPLEQDHGAGAFDQRTPGGNPIALDVLSIAAAQQPRGLARMRSQQEVQGGKGLPAQSAGTIGVGQRRERVGVDHDPHARTRARHRVEEIEDEVLRRQVETQPRAEGQGIGFFQFSEQQLNLGGLQKTLCAGKTALHRFGVRDREPGGKLGRRGGDHITRAAPQSTPDHQVQRPGQAARATHHEQAPQRTLVRIDGALGGKWQAFGHPLQDTPPYPPEMSSVEPRRPKKLETYQDADYAARYDHRWDGSSGAARDARKAATIRRAWDSLIAATGETPQSVLDLPAGTGRFTALLQELCPGTVLAADLSLAMLGEARQKHPGIQACVADAARLPFADDAFDAVVCIRFLHLVRDRALRIDFLREFGRVARLGVIVDYRHGRTLRIWGRHLRHRLGLLPLAPANPSPRAILDEVDAAGLRLVQKHPVRFAPLLSDKVLHVALP